MLRGYIYHERAVNLGSEVTGARIYPIGHVNFNQPVILPD